MITAPTKPRMSPAREAALAVLEAIVEAHGRAVRGMDVLPVWIEAPVVALVDAVLGGALGSTLLYEWPVASAREFEVQGRTYTIRTVDDLRTYLEREVPEPGR